MNNLVYVDEINAGKRIDSFLAANTECSRANIQRLLSGTENKLSVGKNK